jgi:8-oxo-dGTP pyrophosphatase MutT (NUDIX family)
MRGDDIAQVKTYRYPLGDWQWALQRGFGHGADHLESARAELREELGVQAASWRVLGEVTPDSGLLASRVVVLLAAVEAPELTPVDVLEVREARWFPASAVMQMVRPGALQDGFTLSALLLAAAARVVPLTAALR